MQIISLLTCASCQYLLSDGRERDSALAVKTLISMQQATLPGQRHCLW